MTQTISEKTKAAAAAARRPGGTNTKELAADLKMSTGAASSRLQSAVLVFGIWKASNGRSSRWFGTRAEAAAWGTLDPYRPAHTYNGSALTKPAKTKALRLAADLPIDMSRAKVTVCPPFVDRRWAVETPPGWVGAITRDWRERRLQEAKL